MEGFCNFLSLWSIPFVLFLIPCAAALRGVPLYETFVAGAKDGLRTAARILPFLLAMMVAIALLRDSGALERLTRCVLPLLDFFGVSPELIPLAVVRPLSGTGALGLATEMMRTFGPDSLLGRTASAMLGSSDTTFYILTVYFGAVGVTKVRYALWVGLSGDLAAFFLSVYFCRWFFGG